MVRRTLVALVLAAISVWACQKQHPVSVYVNPRFNDAKGSPDQAIQKIAVMTCASSLAHVDDPDEVAPKMMERFLVPALQERSDYKLIASNTVEYAVDKTSSREAYTKFLKSYAMSDKPDMAFLAPLAKELQCDAFLIPVVDLWQKDEVNVLENSTPATYVGATITIVSAEDGAVLFRATDEDYVEGASNETSEQSLANPSGAYTDPGAKVHRAPPFEDVAGKVARSLASSLPVR